jgi:hypothetical protein
MALELILRSKSPSWRMTALSSTLAGVLVPFGLVQAMGLERIAAPVTTGAGDAIGLRVKEAGERLACVDTVLDRGTMSCPQDCMIPTNQLGMTNADSCVLAVAGNWQCRWPTQWVTEQVPCNEAAADIARFNGGVLTVSNGSPSTVVSGWTGQATVRREYEIQQCGQVVIPTGVPLQLLDTSQCSRNRNEADTFACPDRANAYLADELGGPVGTMWRAATSRETNWVGAGVTLGRAVVDALTLSGQVEIRSRGDWGVTNVACQRVAERQVFVPCDGTMVEVCDDPVVTPSSTIVTTSTVLSGTEIVNITQTIVVQGVTLPPVCNTVAAGNAFAGCITDFRPGTITVNANQPAVITGYNQWGYPLMSRPWSYSTTNSVYNTSCRGPISGNFNSGMTITTMGLGNDLSATTVISAQPPILLQQKCSQAGMSSGWTTHDYGGGGGGHGGDSGNGGGGTDGSGCSCDGGSTDGSNDCGDSY